MCRSSEKRLTSRADFGVENLVRSIAIVDGVPTRIIHVWSGRRWSIE
jgi:hypothetical protein